MRLVRRSGVALAATILLALAISPGVALATIGNHGIGLNKGCDSPTTIGDPYTCTYTIFNINPVESVGDDLTFTSLVDVINRPGSPSSGNILSIPGIQAQMTFNDGGAGMPSCTGLGTATPVCTLPGSAVLLERSSIQIVDFSFYNVVAADFGLNPTTHELTDSVDLTWQDTCNGSGPPTNCPAGNQHATTGSSTTIEQLDSTTATAIHNSSHETVTTTHAGNTVHDFVTVTGQPNQPVPTGNVNIDWFLNGTCTGTPAQNSGSVGPLAANGTFDATGFAFQVTSPGMRAFQAHYEGDATYTGSTGPCEPLQVVFARIAISPNAANEVGVPHTFTVTLEQNLGDGAGYVPFAGQHVDVTLTDTNGATHSAPTGSCTTAGPNTDAAGHCTITFTSLTTGTVTGHATATVSVAGSTPFTIQTTGFPPNSGDATKVFQDANIQITPDGTNRVGANHTFTAHANADLGDGTGFHNAPDGTVITFTKVDSNGATSTPNPPTQCTTSGGTGSCSTTITSPTTGKSTVSAHTTFTTPQGVVLTRSTNGVGANSGPAVKTFVNARISITPNDTNEIGDPHTFTVKLEKDLGDGAGFVAFAGAHVNFNLANSNGAGAVLDAALSTCDDAGANTDAAGQCTITFTSPTPGQVTGTASWTGSLGTPTPFTVTTNGTGGSSGPAVKTFVDANIQISPLTDTNPVATNHTLTGHVNVNAGGGSFANAPAGTVITFDLSNAGGATAAFVGPSTCATVGTTGSCTVIISSPTTGTTTIGAATNVTVGGVVLHRETGDGLTGDSADAVKRWANATVRTDVHNAAHAVILKVVTGTAVHDKAFVVRTADTPAAVPNPTGTVTFHRYPSLNCTGSPVDETVSLAADGTAESATVTATADLCYRADYSGDANYPARTGAIEPLDVIHPATSLTIVGTPITTLTVGQVVTLTINEKNTGDDPITDVHVTGGSAGASPNCTWVPVGTFDGTLDPGESQNFTCTFTVGNDPISWAAHGQGLDSLGNPVPRFGEDLEAMPETASLTPLSPIATAGISPWLGLGLVAILIIGLAFVTPVPSRVRRRTQ